MSDIRAKPQFTQRVLAVVQTIPAGTTKTYQEVASLAGNPRAYRAVGTILKTIWQTDHGQTIPCHRVIRANGQLGGYAGGAAEKARWLAAEQFEVESN